MENEISYTFDIEILWYNMFIINIRTDYRSDRMEGRTVEFSRSEQMHVVHLKDLNVAERELEWKYGILSNDRGNERIFKKK